MKNKFEGFCTSITSMHTHTVHRKLIGIIWQRKSYLQNGFNLELQNITHNHMLWIFIIHIKINIKIPCGRIES